MMRIPLFLGLFVLAVLFVYSTVFVVDERKQALILRFGKVRDVLTEPGLKFKLPAPIETVAFYEKRILPLDTSELEVTPADDRRLVVDAFARWRIVDPVRFRQRVSSMLDAQTKLERILNASLREVLGSQSSNAIISGERTQLMQEIRDESRRQADVIGIDVFDVRIRRADLPEQNLKATYDRMKAEREREAADERARGAEAAQRVRARANREAVEIVSEAQRKSQIVRGEADAERNRIYARAFGRDPEFFAFYRSLSAYKAALTDEKSRIVLSPDSEFFTYLKSGEGLQP